MTKEIIKEYKEYWHSFIADSRPETKTPQQPLFLDYVRFFISDIGDISRTNMLYAGQPPSDKSILIKKFGFYVKFSNPEMYRDFFDSVFEFVVANKIMFQMPASDIAASKDWPDYMEYWVEPTRRIGILPRMDFYGTIISTKRFKKQMQRIQKGKDKNAYAEIKFMFAGDLRNN
jgi:hypothetical protein